MPSMILVPVSVVLQCPQWESFDNTQHTQFCFVFTPSNWTTAKYTCENNGGCLTSIQAVKGIVKEIAHESGKCVNNGKWWIGLQQQEDLSGCSDVCSKCSNTDSTESHNCLFLQIMLQTVGNPRIKNRTQTGSCDDSYC